MPGKAKTAKKVPKAFTHEVAVVGLGFRLKRDVRRALADTVARRPVDGIVLVREQENRYDDNAIMVKHPDRGPLAGKHLGYLRADTAAILAPLMDDYAATAASGEPEGMRFAKAELVELDADDDYKTGSLVVTFHDYR